MNLPYLIWLICFVNILIRVSLTSTPNSLNGQHLRVIWTRWSGNPKGLLGPLKSGVILEYLSSRLNFTYEMIRVTHHRLDPSEKGEGLFNYLWDQKCELVAQDVVSTFQRNKVVDLTANCIFDNVAFLIPVPDETANINAVVKPFQWPIWVGLGVSIVCVIVVLSSIQRYLEYQTAGQLTNDGGGLRVITKTITGKQYLYVFGNLLSQGGCCPSHRLPYRLVAGVWSLAAFIFVQAYTSTLFTYVVTPINHPLINSIYDIVDSSDINLLVRESGMINLLLKSNNQTSRLFGEIRKNLDSYPYSRCPLISDCIKLMTPESRNVFADATVYLKDEIRKDFQKTGKCNFQIAKEVFIGTASSFALAKNSPYTKSLSQGILELHQIGLVDFWDTWFRPMSPQCDGKPQNVNKKDKVMPISLKKVTGAFLVLLGGMSLSILAFLGEKIVSFRQRRLAVVTI
uniref:Ionotropic glutamate receptor C-terminal domain-containing protein n=1 Tax=Daphnia galeata TaxID=27404 RepID=A0A8J2REK9_9CRUS|nr:unnamed protein product [Daphnia galeata]